jgi:hypothetical protein
VFIGRRLGAPVLRGRVAFGNADCRPGGLVARESHLGLLRIAKEGAVLVRARGCRHVAGRLHALRPIREPLCRPTDAPGVGGWSPGVRIQEPVMTSKTVTAIEDPSCPGQKK